MNERRPAWSRTQRMGTGGALILAGLIVGVLVVALLAGFVAVRDLGSAARESKLLYDVQERLDSLIRLQLDEETSLRGYLIAKRREFLEPFLSSAIDPFEERYAQLDQTLRTTDLAPARLHLSRIDEWHRTWRSQVAEPLIGDGGGSVDAREAYGKILNDRIGNEAAALRAYLAQRNDYVQRELAANINRTVEVAIGFVFIFALAALYLTLAQRTTSAALEREHSIAASLQAALGVGWQAIPGSTIGTAYVSATREADIGGDLFDAWQLDDDRGAILIADMSGKGIDAVVNTAFCKYSIRALLKTYDDPGRVMAEFNRLFARTVADPSMFAVAFLGVLDARTGLLRYTSAGHEPAFCRRGASVKQLEIGGPIVGLLPDSHYNASSERLGRHDFVVVATDGLTESRNGSGEMLGASGAAALIAAAPAEPQALCDTLIGAVRERSGGTIFDDLALLALRFERDGGPTEVVAETR